MHQLRFTNPKLQEFPIDLRFRPKKNLLIGIFLILAALLIALVGFLFIFILLSDRQSCIFIHLLISAAIVNSLVRVIRLAHRHFINPAKKLQGDPRDPVLYLRSFYDDYEEIPAYQSRRTPEEVLARILRRVGPVIAIGKPGEEGLPFLGATRIYLKDENWRPHVKKLISISQLVVIHADISLGVLWELEAVKQLVEPQRLLISLLLWQSYDDDLRRRFYEQFSKLFTKVFERNLPAWTDHMTLIYFESGWTPCSIEIEPRYPLFNPWIPFIDISYSPFIPPEDIRDALIPIFRLRGMIQ
jgi:hypothetical protein